jgi:putative spermidine/putrescine transport system ATP-binding protein
VGDSLPGKTRSLPIRIKSLTKRYGSVTALDAVDLDVEAGEFITLLGPSGSGKTTLLMILAGFVRPDVGSIGVDGHEIVLTPPNKRNIGMVFQNYALFPHMNVFGNVAFGLRQRRVPEAEIRYRVHQVLDLVQLHNLSERRIDQLSGGQKQRVALARAIVFEPRILLMDEPLSALDKKLREQMQIELRRLHRTLGVTTIYVTHDQREAITMSDRIAVMNHGRVVQLDTPKNLYSGPRTRFVAEFIGESSLLPVAIDRRGVVFQDRVLRSSCPAVPGHSKAWLVIRPERLLLLGQGQSNPSLNVFEGQVAEVVYQGESILLYAALGDGSQLAARLYIRDETLTRLPHVGATIRLGINPEDTAIVYEDETP